MQTLTQHAPAEQMKDILSQTFSEDLDGYWTPDLPGLPLVRIQVAASGYQIERRRNTDSPWMPIVTADIAEFDTAAFRQWQTRWPMVADR